MLVVVLLSDGNSISWHNQPPQQSMVLLLVTLLQIGSIDCVRWQHQPLQQLAHGGQQQQQQDGGVARATAVEQPLGAGDDDDDAAQQ